jgi:Tfp pilus assembly protein PilN
MLHTNLSTRPFYNQRGVHAILAVAAVLVIGLTIFNVTQIVRLSSRQSELSARAAAAEARAGELRAHAVDVRQSVNAKQLNAISGSAREANVIISQRLFSWTNLLNQLETTLPEEVRITSMRPTVEKDGSVKVQMTLAGRRVEDIDRFMENLEGTGVFADVFSREDVTAEDGLLQATVEGTYVITR